MAKERENQELKELLSKVNCKLVILFKRYYPA
jgi:hypothetical protein